MKRKIVLSLFLLLCVTLAQAQIPTAKNKPEDSSKLKEEIGKILQELADASMRRDEKTFDRYLAPAFLLVNPQNETKTRAEFLSSVTSEIPPNFKVSITDEELEVNGDKNSAVATYRELFAIGQNQERLELPQRVSTFFVRNGSNWQILAQHRTYLPQIPVPRKLDSKTLDAITGEYQIEGGGTVMVTREGDKVYSQRTNSVKLELTPDSEITFYAKMGNQVMGFAFIRDSGGKVTYMIVGPPPPGAGLLIRKKIK